MRYYVGNYFYGDDFWHYGVKGQKKGVRRYQNPDGSLKPEGYSHYGRNPHPKSRKKKASSVKQFLQKIFGRKSPTKVIKPMRHISKVPDDELDAATNRLNKEKQYFRAVADRKQAIRDSRRKEEKKMSEGKKFIITKICTLTENVTKEWIKDNSPNKGNN